MKNHIQDVRNHLVAMMEALGDNEANQETVARAKAVSDLAQAYTHTVRVELDARRLAGIEAELPEVIARKPALPHAAMKAVGHG